MDNLAQYLPYMTLKTRIAVLTQIQDAFSVFKKVGDQNSTARCV